MTTTPEKDQPALTNKELAHLRQIMEADNRARWLWSSVRTIAVWIAAVIAGATLLLDTIASGIKTLLGKG